MVAAQNIRISVISFLSSNRWLRHLRNTGHGVDFDLDATPEYRLDCSSGGPNAREELFENCIEPIEILNVAQVTCAFDHILGATSGSVQDLYHVIERQPRLLFDGSLYYSAGAHIDGPLAAYVKPTVDQYSS